MLLHAFPSMFVNSLREFPENYAYKHGELNLHRKLLDAHFLPYDIESVIEKCIYWICVLRQ